MRVLVAFSFVLYEIRADRSRARKSVSVIEKEEYCGF
jgi:hypothetical protein